ncbi:MAG TPA: orotate phosphoribosyltransferase [bacterium]|nr:orotate phosphoribosyltransferase [bacterium]
MDRGRVPEAVLADLRARTWAQLSRAAFLRGEYVLSSGRTSPYYIDKYQFETHPDLLRDIARLLAGALPPETTRLVGPALGGVPLATAVALETGIPFVIVRPEAKAHGTARTIEGTLEAGDRVVVLEDVVTTGGQAVRAARAVEAAGGHVLLILAVVDRHEGGREGVERAGYRFEALYDLQEWPIPHG